MVKTLKKQNKEGNKEDDKLSSKHSESMGKSKHRFYPAKNTSKIVIQETENHNVFFLFIFSI